MASAAVVFVVVIIALVVAVLTVFVVVPVTVFFCGQERAKCPSCLHSQQSGLRPSTVTVIVVSLYIITCGIEWNLPLSKIMLKT